MTGFRLNDFKANQEIACYSLFQMVGLWILAVLVAWVINEIRDDWRA